jgi:hypothetical protein
MEEHRPKPLGSHPIDIQETFLIEDLLYAMTSIEGVYIKRPNLGQAAALSRPPQVNNL